MTMHWESWGYKRDVHWTIGKRPPKHLGWEKPLIEPHSWENIISFYNGSIIQIISQDRKGTSNSKSFDFLFIDEAKFIKFERLKDETFLANRGQQREFGHCPFHHGMLVTSDMPITKEGSWFLNYENKMDPELIAAIVALRDERWKHLNRIKQFGVDSVPDYLPKRVARIEQLLSELRKYALFYRTYSCLLYTSPSPRDRG